jgi:hypothetical protein
MVTRADHLNETEMNAVEPQPIIKEERPSYDRMPYGMEGGDRGDRGDRAPRGDRPDRAPRPRKEEPHPADAGADKQ